VDVQWAVRRLFEAMARRQPLVVVFDDIHWAEPAMLDLIEHVAANAAGPILLACLARGDLLERRPGWADAGGRGSIIRLEPLSDTDSARLLGKLATRRRAKVRREEVMYAAEGNPLFLEQLVAMRADDPGVRTPPTIQALLAARIDALPQRDRRVIEAAAIEGRGFHRGAVRALVDQKRSVDAALSALADRELIRPDRSELPDETGYRFTHILVRDAAYDLLPKRRRADLHVAYADWLLKRVERGSAADEIVGYHLERAFEYRSQLGRAGDERHRTLAERASTYLSAAGRRALDAGERSGAANLLGRAAALHARDDPDRAALLIDLGGVLREEGRFGESESVLREARRLAVELGDAPLEARAQVGRLLSRLQVDPDAVARLMERQGDQLAAALQKGDDAAGLARLWHLRALLWWIRSQAGKAEDAWRQAHREADRAGDGRVAIDVLGWEASSMYWGPTATAGAIARCEEIEAASAADPWARALAQHPHAGLLAMEGRFAEADRIFSDANRVLAEFGETVDAAVSHPQASSAILVGNPAAAVSHLREGRERLRRMGERAVLVGTDGYLAEALFLCGDVRGAMRLTRTCESEATADDVSAQVVWRRVRARILALRGRTAEAERLAREAVALSQSTDWITLTAGALVDLAHVLMLSGREAERRRTFREAIALYNAKGNVAGARRATREMEGVRRSARLVSA
jgi:tetratricopeptide (TPR) repeat protein